MIIGISGKMGSGKDTIADYLAFKHGFKKVSFANELKIMCMKYFGFTEEEVFQTKPPEVRKALQGAGAMMRSIDPDFWINKLGAKTRDVPANFVISDVRYLNEAVYVQKYLGFLIRVERPGNPMIVSDEAKNHLSETELDDYFYFDGKIQNDGSTLELFNKVDLFVGRMKN